MQPGIERSTEFVRLAPAKAKGIRSNGNCAIAMLEIPRFNTIASTRDMPRTSPVASLVKRAGFFRAIKAAVGKKFGYKTLASRRCIRSVGLDRFAGDAILVCE